MPIKDLRDWMEKVEAMGELKRVRGAHWDKEIGGIADLYQRKMGLPALYFSGVPGFPEDYGILVNPCTSLKCVALGLGLPVELDEIELIQAWRRYLRTLKSI